MSARVPIVSRGRAVRLITLWRGEELDLQVELPVYLRVATRCRARTVEVTLDVAGLIDAAAIAAVRANGRAELGSFIAAAVVG
jgi:hypothetical protein